MSTPDENTPPPPEATEIRESLIDTAIGAAGLGLSAYSVYQQSKQDPPPPPPPPPPAAEPDEPFDWPEA